MAKAAHKDTLLEFFYGREDLISRDVDLFEAFYTKRFRKRITASFEKRMRKRWGILAIASVVSACLFSIPMFVNANSLFARLILVMGAMLLAVGIFYATRFARVQNYCVTHFDEMLSNEFMSARTVTKRVFCIHFYEEQVEVDFGIITGVRQKRVKRYSDITAVYETDELLFIEGLTWLSCFQIDENVFHSMQLILKEKCRDRYYDANKNI